MNNELTKLVYPSQQSLHNDIITEQSTVINDAVTSRDSKRICDQNPYMSFSNTSFSDIAKRSDDWISKENIHLKNIIHKSKGGYNRFRFDAFQQMSTCTQRTCIGGPCSSDQSKIMCGSYSILQSPCVVYSIGSNNKWGFEMDILQNTPCDVYSFDCTGPRSRFQVPENVRMHFYYKCLGSEYAPAPKITPGTKGIRGEIMTLQQIKEMLNHTQIDLLKFDIEGFEWPIFESWPEATDPLYEETILPMQVLVEVHYRTHMTDLALSSGYDFKYDTDFVRLASHLLKVGYATMIRDDNPHCRHCTELTLFRYRCPETKPM